MSKRSVSIETLVRWAYCDELPKVATGRGPMFGPAGAGGAWGAVAAQGEVMAALVSDGRPNAYGVLPISDGSDEPPHPDALAIGEAVRGLADVSFYLPDDWQPFGDMDLGEDAGRLAEEARGLLAGQPSMALEPGRIIVTRAILGGAPEWEDGPIVRRWMTYPNGKPIWFIREQRQDEMGAWFEIETVTGFDARRQRPRPGAYRKAVFLPDPASVARGRAEYQVWVTALDYLAAVLAGRLRDFEPVECGRSPAPWLESAGRGVRVLAATGT